MITYVNRVPFPSGLAPEKEQDKLMSLGLSLEQVNQSSLEYHGFTDELDAVFMMIRNNFFLEAKYSESTLTFRNMIMGEFGDVDARTGKRSFGENGVYYIYDVTTDALGNETYGNFSLLINTSNGDLSIPIDFSDGSVSNSEQLKYVEKLAGAFDTILQADPTYFDALYGGNYRIDIMSGFSIALTTPNAKVESDYYPGMYCPDEISDNKATIKLASELFSGKKAYDPQTGLVYSLTYHAKYSNIFGFLYEYTQVKYSVWEAVAHEFGHHLDFLKYGRSTFNSWDYDQGEISTINRVNTLRTYYNMRQEYHIPLNERKK